MATASVVAAGGAGSKKPQLVAALAIFEPQFFNNMISVRDNLFVHRRGARRRRIGIRLNEVRVLCNSLLTHKGVLLADKTVKLDPAKSILGYGVGDDIALSEKPSSQGRLPCAASGCTWAGSFGETAGT